MGWLGGRDVVTSTSSVRAAQHCDEIRELLLCVERVVLHGLFVAKKGIGAKVLG